MSIKGEEQSNEGQELDNSLNDLNQGANTLRNGIDYGRKIADRLNPKDHDKDKASDKNGDNDSDGKKEGENGENVKGKDGAKSEGNKGGESTSPSSPNSPSSPSLHTSYDSPTGIKQPKAPGRRNPSRVGKKTAQKASEEAGKEAGKKTGKEIAKKVAKDTAKTASKTIAKGLHIFNLTAVIPTIASAIFSIITFIVLNPVIFLFMFAFLLMADPDLTNLVGDALTRQIVQASDIVFSYSKPDNTPTEEWNAFTKGVNDLIGDVFKTPKTDQNGEEEYSIDLGKFNPMNAATMQMHYANALAIDTSKKAWRLIEEDVEDAGIEKAKRPKREAAISEELRKLREQVKSGTLTEEEYSAKEKEMKDTPLYIITNSEGQEINSMYGLYYYKETDAKNNPNYTYTAKQHVNFGTYFSIVDMMIEYIETFSSDGKQYTAADVAPVSDYKPSEQATIAVQIAEENGRSATEGGMSSTDNAMQYAVSHTAMQVIGKVPYEWNGKPTGPYWDNRWGVNKKSTPNEFDDYDCGLDCSGFVKWMYWTISRSKTEPKGIGSTQEMWDTFSSRMHSLEDNNELYTLEPGDVLWKKGHCAIYGGTMRPQDGMNTALGEHDTSSMRGELKNCTTIIYEADGDGDINGTAHGGHNTVVVTIHKALDIGNGDFLPNVGGFTHYIKAADIYDYNGWQFSAGETGFNMNEVEAEEGTGAIFPYDLGSGVQKAIDELPELDQQYTQMRYLSDDKIRNHMYALTYLQSDDLKPDIVRVYTFDYQMLCSMEPGITPESLWTNSNEESAQNVSSTFFDVAESRTQNMREVLANPSSVTAIQKSSEGDNSLVDDFNELTCEMGLENVVPKNMVHIGNPLSALAVGNVGAVDELINGNVQVVISGDNADIIWNSLRNSGYSEMAAAAILGNIQAESGCDPNAIESNGAGHGLMQWSYGRWSDPDPNKADCLMNYANNVGQPWNDLSTQIAFMIGVDLPYNFSYHIEYKGQYMTGSEAMALAESPEDAAAILQMTVFRGAWFSSEEEWRNSKYGPDGSYYIRWSNFVYAGDNITRDGKPVYMVGGARRMGAARSAYEQYHGK